jgi:hypothetical protein
MSLPLTIPAIGDECCSGALVYTVTGVFGLDPVEAAEAGLSVAVKVVLDHPLAGELHLPYDDFIRYVDRGIFTLMMAATTDDQRARFDEWA